MADEKITTTGIAAHGASRLPSVDIESFNIELKDDEGFLGDRASKAAFRDILEKWRKPLRKSDEDPFGKEPSENISKRVLDAILVERIVVGGGFRDSRLGELAIARTEIILKAEDFKIEMLPIRHHPDDAGLIGALHLAPSWIFEGHDSILAVDIGGTNIRCGVIETRSKKSPDLSKASVWKSELWRHADDEPSREEAVKRLIKMLRDLVAKADKEEFKLAPFIGIACPGVIESDGSIEKGAQNLPGNWESSKFNLPASLVEAVPQIGEHDTAIVMHNDGVVQGLSEVPFMQDVKRWGVLTIGTGLGNARFTNRNGNGKRER